MKHKKTASGGDRRLRPWEIALLAALVLALGAGALAGRTQERLSERFIRLHVVANSNSPADQAEKLQMRDRVLALVSPALADCADRDEAEAVLRAFRPALEALGDVTVELGREYFPTRRYPTFSLPAGEYLSLRVVMGAGAGRNWWCVIFPPLCGEAVSGSETDAFLALDEEDRALITRDGPTYELRFRLAELWGELMAALEGQDPGDFGRSGTVGGTSSPRTISASPP